MNYIVRHGRRIDVETHTFGIQPSKKRRGQFIMVPCAWVEKLAKSRSANTYRVALQLLHLHWKDKGDPIKLANGVLAMGGVTRFSKWRALRQLEGAGLIKIERRPRKSPVIVVVL